MLGLHVFSRFEVVSSFRMLQNTAKRSEDNKFIDVFFSVVFLSFWLSPCVACCATWLGYLRLPFSITWWLVLLAAYAIQTRRAKGAGDIWCHVYGVMVGPDNDPPH